MVRAQICESLVWNLIFCCSSIGLSKKVFWTFYLFCFVVFCYMSYFLPPKGKYFATRTGWAKALGLEGLEGISGFYHLKSVQITQEMQVFLPEQEMTVLVGKIYCLKFFSDHIIFSIEFYFQTQWLDVKDFHIFQPYCFGWMWMLW